MAAASSTPVPLMTLDAACELAQKILDMLRDQNKTWDANLFRGAECFVSYAERDGVVYRQGQRSSTERPMRAEASKICLRMKVNGQLGNQFGTMHGGCLATIVDTCSSFLTLLHSSGVAGEPWSMMGVTQALIVQYLKPTRVGKWIEVETTMRSISKTLCLLHVNIYELDGRDGQRTAHTVTGSHNKMDIRPKL